MIHNFIVERGGQIYILTNYKHTVLYIGVTSDLQSRVMEHKARIMEKCFTSRYNVALLVYYEKHATIEEAIAREKFLKGKSRSYKINLINAINPEWNDLFNEIKDW